MPQLHAAPPGRGPVEACGDVAEQSFAPASRQAPPRIHGVTLNADVTRGHAVGHQAPCADLRVRIPSRCPGPATMPPSRSRAPRFVGDGWGPESRECPSDLVAGIERADLFSRRPVGHVFPRHSPAGAGPHKSKLGSPSSRRPIAGTAPLTSGRCERLPSERPADFSPPHDAPSLSRTSIDRAISSLSDGRSGGRNSRCVSRGRSDTPAPRARSPPLAPATAAGAWSKNGPRARRRHPPRSRRRPRNLAFQKSVSSVSSRGIGSEKMSTWEEEGATSFRSLRAHGESAGVPRTLESPTSRRRETWSRS